MEGDAETWDASVRSRPSGTVFHLLAWSNAVEEAYGHPAVHLMKREQGLTLMPRCW